MQLNEQLTLKIVWAYAGEKQTNLIQSESLYLPARAAPFKNREDARLWALPRQVISQLDRLTAQRARLTKAIKLLKTPLTNTAGFISKEDRKANSQACDHSLKALKADLKSTDKSIAAVIERDPELTHLFERVTSIKGISQTTAVEVIITNPIFFYATRGAFCTFF